MERGRKVLCRTIVKQGNTGNILDRESAVDRGSKYYGMRTTYFAVDTNSTRKKVFQTSHGVAEVVLV